MGHPSGPRSAFAGKASAARIPHALLGPFLRPGEVLVGPKIIGPHRVFRAPLFRAKPRGKRGTEDGAIVAGAPDASGRRIGIARISIGASNMEARLNYAKVAPGRHPAAAGPSDLPSHV